MSAPEQSRQSRGIPSGGQYAAELRTESGVQLQDVATVAPAFCAQLGISAKEPITDHHPDFCEIDRYSWVVHEDWDDLEHAVGVYHHLPSGRLVGAETIGSIADYQSDGAGLPLGSDLYEITGPEQVAEFGPRAEMLVEDHLAQVPIVDDADHLTPARIEQQITAGLPDGVTVCPGTVAFAIADFDREIPGARGPAAADVQMSAYLTKGKTEYNVHVAAGIATARRRNVFGGTTLGQAPLQSATPAGLGAAINEALTSSPP